MRLMEADNKMRERKRQRKKEKNDEIQPNLAVTGFCLFCLEE